MPVFTAYTCRLALFVYLLNSFNKHLLFNNVYVCINKMKTITIVGLLFVAMTYGTKSYSAMIDLCKRGKLGFGVARSLGHFQCEVPEEVVKSAKTLKFVFYTGHVTKNFLHEYGLISLEELILKGNKITKIDAQAFAALPKLKTLNL